MGLGFGQLYKMRAIVTFALSPFEQRAYAGALKNGVPNTLRRISESMLYVAPPLLSAAGFYHLVEERHNRLMRKNPADFEDEE